MLLTCLCGCGESGQTEIQNHGNAVANEYSDMYRQKSVMRENNITVEDIPVDSSFAYSGYVAVHGLKDEKVEQSINEQIKQMFDRLYDDSYYPPYRGMKLRLAQFEEKHEQYEIRRDVNVYNMFNFNGVLCVYAYLDIMLEDGDNTFWSIGEADALTFDLATGEVLTLADFFDKNTDYIALLNKEVDDYLMKNGFDSGSEEKSIDFEYVAGPSITLTAPFKGIKPEQKFFVDYQGGINLVMDYETPEFRVGDFPITLDLDRDVNQVLCSNGKYNDIFTDNAENLCLVENVNDYTKKVDIFESFEAGQNFKVYLNLVTSSALPEKVGAAVEEVMRDYEHAPIDVTAQYRFAKATADFSDWSMSCMKNASLVCVRDYVGVYDMMYVDIESDYQYYDSCMMFTTFKGDNPEPLRIENVFVNPADASALIEKAIIDNLVRKYGEEIEPDARAIASELCTRVSGFIVQPDLFNLSFNMPINELQSMIDEHFDTELAISPYEVGLVSYRDIGCENLNIFD